jgi:hypothetical protein
MMTCSARLPLSADGTASLEMTYDRPVTAQSLRVFVADAQPPLPRPVIAPMLRRWWMAHGRSWAT